MDVHLDGVYTNEAALIAELERKLGGRVAYQEITEIDLVHGHMPIDVRLRPGQGVIEPPPEKARHYHHAADVSPRCGRRHTGAGGIRGRHGVGERAAGSSFGTRADEVRGGG
jgi:hypothetical protein